MFTPDAKVVPPVVMKWKGVLMCVTVAGSPFISVLFQYVALKPGLPSLLHWLKVLASVVVSVRSHPCS